MAQSSWTQFLYEDSASIGSLVSLSQNMHHYVSPISHQSKIEKLPKIQDYSSTTRHGNINPMVHDSADNAWNFEKKTIFKKMFKILKSPYTLHFIVRESLCICQAKPEIPNKKFQDFKKEKFKILK